jgi:predicted nucleic acid-binding Zn ribbon protein
MPTYIYETLPQNEVEAPKRFEVRQSMNDKALTHHPDTGVPVRRVIVGGTGFSGAKSGGSGSSAPSGGSCGTGCGCH